MTSKTQDNIKKATLIAKAKPKLTLLVSGTLKIMPTGQPLKDIHKNMLQGSRNVPTKPETKSKLTVRKPRL